MFSGLKMNSGRKASVQESPVCSTTISAGSSWFGSTGLFSGSALQPVSEFCFGVYHEIFNFDDYSVYVLLSLDNLFVPRGILVPTCRECVPDGSDPTESICNRKFFPESYQNFGWH